MPRPKSLKPSHCHHRPTNRGYVRLGGKMTYTGLWGSQAAKDEYDRLIGEWIADGRRIAQDTPGDAEHAGGGISLNGLLAAFLLHARDYYKTSDGSPGEEYKAFIKAMYYPRRLYGKTAAKDFGPRALKVVRQAMIDGEPNGRRGWCRSYANHQTQRIKAIFQWAVAQEIVPPAVYQSLQAVAGLRAGKSNAREAEPVKPASDRTIEIVLPYLPAPVAAMVQLQLLTGARSGELCIMRVCDIDRSGKVWIFRPSHHKTEHHGLTREIAIGPQAQEILTPFLKLDLQAFCFSPADAERDRHERQRAERATGVQPSQIRRAAMAKRRKRTRPPLDHYTPHSYGRAIARACDKADADQREQAKQQGITVAGRLVERFHPHQLRHNAATNIRRDFGIDAARAVLGHHSEAVTLRYAEQDRAKVTKIMEQVG